MSGRVGMMQGRLLPKVDDRIQAFPGDRWPEEFPLLAGLGYNAIELTIEMASWDSHPIRSPKGRARISDLSAEHDIHVVGLCGDNFMECPLVADDPATCRSSVVQLLTMLDDCAALGLGFVELPMMGVNSLRSDNAKQLFDSAIDKILTHAKAVGVDIVLESDLPADELATLMDAYAHPCLGVNYDMGNSTWFGFHPDDELPKYGQHIRNVHVKDCTRADYSVPLGKGETEIPHVFAGLAAIGYDGDFILQAARQADDLAAARDYRAYLQEYCAL
ncbi:MAG TPA: hypothetical protein DC046_09020 [Rhodospirillaceae bacterium]|nr:hypothetical protein [Rhodospirillaceae bacterium]